MIKDILPLIPDHKIYVEPFFGGGAIFWAKEPVQCEVINDVNGNVTNFFQVLKHDFFRLQEAIEQTPHSRDIYSQAMVVYKCPWLFDRIVRAWSFWVVTNQGFSCKIGTWGYDRSKAAHRVANKVEAFKEVLSDRLRYTQITNDPADRVITSRDSPETFVYADPPYINTNQGHYGGYTEEHFQRDLDALSRIEGKFLLSTFQSDIIDKYIKKFNWCSMPIEKQLSAGNGRLRKSKKKVEVLTANYSIE